MKNKIIRNAAVVLSATALAFSLIVLVEHVNKKTITQLPQNEEPSVNLYIDPASPWNNGDVITTDKQETEQYTTTTETEKTESTSAKKQEKKESSVTKKQTEKQAEVPVQVSEVIEETNPPVTEAEEKTVQETEATYEEDPAYNGRIGTMYITGYTAEEGFYEGSPTASGVGAGPGTCAMNNSQRQSLGIKYGDRIYVEGLGTYTVTNCGCDWGVVDIWLYTNAEAYAITGYYTVYYA